MAKLKGLGKNSTYKIGIIGGMGSLASAEFYRRIVLRTDAKADIEHNNMVILNHATLPDRTYCICYGQEERFLQDIKEDFDILNAIKVDVIALPCNTSHYFYDNFKEMTDIKVLNMIESTIRTILDKGFKKAKIFSTIGTYSSGLYHKYAQEMGLEIIDIEDSVNADVSSIIRGVKVSNRPELAQVQFNSIISSNCSEEVVGIVACTELSLIKLSDENKKFTVDALDVLVEETLKV